jgi:hypothetical protein
MEADREAFCRKLPRRLDHVGPLELAMSLKRHGQAGYGSGDTRRPVTDCRSLSYDITIFVEVHVTRSSERRALAIVYDFGVAVGAPYHHEAPASDVAGRRPGDGKRQRNSDRCIHRIAASLHNFNPDLGCYDICRGDHAVTSADGLIRRRTRC